MTAQGYKGGLLVCTWEMPEITIGQNGYDIDTLIVDGVTHAVSPTDPNPLTDVEILFQRVQLKLNTDEQNRTGRPVVLEGAVPISRALAATVLLHSAWSYPSEADLDSDFNKQLLMKIYEDPTTKTTQESSVNQKRSVLHFSLVMLAGQQFGFDYQEELGAYERTASKKFHEKLLADDRDWLKLKCPKMHKDFPEFDSVQDMFLTVMK